MHLGLIELGRIGFGVAYLFAVYIDLKTRSTLFQLMAKKHVPLPRLFYIGAITWKTLTSLGLILNYHILWSAIALAIYIFIANLIFNNFWAVSKEQRDFSMYMFTTHLVTCFGLLAIAGAASS